MTNSLLSCGRNQVDSAIKAGRLAESAVEWSLRGTYAFR